MSTTDEKREGPSGDLAGPAEDGRGLAQWASQLEHRAQAFQALEQRMAALRATETSADGAIRVTVDSNGVPVELTVTERAGGMRPARLSAELMACLGRAQAALTGQVRDLVRDSVPDGWDGAADRIIASYENRFPGQVAPTVPPNRHELRLGEGEDTEDVAHQPILRKPNGGRNTDARRGIYR